MSYRVIVDDRPFIGRIGTSSSTILSLVNRKIIMSTHRGPKLNGSFVLRKFYLYFILLSYSPSFKYIAYDWAEETIHKLGNNLVYKMIKQRNASSFNVNKKKE